MAFGITQETMELIKKKHAVLRRNDPNEYRIICRAVKQSTKRDWENWLSQITDQDLDLRDKWLGIRFLKKKFDSKTYERLR